MINFRANYNDPLDWKDLLFGTLIIIIFGIVLFIIGFTIDYLIK